MADPLLTCQYDGIDPKWQGNKFKERVDHNPTVTYSSGIAGQV